MVIKCKNPNCPTTVVTPQADCWKEKGLCPTCNDHLHEPNDTIKDEFQPQIDASKLTPVDIHFNYMVKEYLRLHPDF